MANPNRGEVWLVDLGYAAKVRRFLREGALDSQNLVTIPHSKLIRRLGSLSSEQLTGVEDRVHFWLGL